MISLDYCQLELRLLAHLSKDDRLQELCRCADFDIHSHIAKIIFDVSRATKEQREEAKESVYATIYGKGWTGGRQDKQRAICSDYIEYFNGE
jgi:DNA polymerase-1